MKKIKNLFIILLSACLVNTWPVYAEEQEYVYAEEQEYVSEEEREFYEYFNLNKNDVEEYSQNLFEEAQKAPIVPDKMDNGFTRSVSGTWSWRDGVICVSDSYTEYYVWASPSNTEKKVQSIR